MLLNIVENCEFEDRQRIIFNITDFKNLSPLKKQRLRLYRF